MKKLLLILAIGASAVMADVGGKDDLLNIATAGKATGASYEMNKEDMQKADGGASSYTIRVYGNPYNVYYPSYSGYKGYHTISIRGW